MLLDQSNTQNMTELCKACHKANKKKSAGKNTTANSSATSPPVCSACMKFFRRFSLRLSRSTSSPSVKNRLLTCSCLSPSKSTTTNGIKKSRMCRACRYNFCCQLGLFDISDETKKSPVNFKTIQCPVCGRPSTGFHFGAICCRGCKTFFARSNRRHTFKSYSCEKSRTTSPTTSNEPNTVNKFPCYASQLIADPSYKSTCKLCRFEKCISVGMSTNSCKIGRHSHRFLANLRKGSSDSVAMPTPSIDGQCTSQFEMPFEIEKNMIGDSVAADFYNTPGTSQAAGSSFSYSSAREDVVAQMRSPIALSPKIWLYSSSSGHFAFDYPQYQSGCHLQQSEFESLRHYLLANPAPVSLAQQLSLPEGARSDWLIARLILSARLLENIREIGASSRPELKAGATFEGIFPAALEFLMENVRVVLHFVKTLPGYDMLCVEDRTLLFAESVFQIMAAEWGLEYDQNTDRLGRFMGMMYDESCQILMRNGFGRVQEVESILTNIGRQTKQANVSIVEFSITAALIFFSTNVSGLRNATIVHTVRNEYLRAQESFVRQQSSISRYVIDTGCASPEYVLRRLEILHQLEQCLHFFRDVAFSTTMDLLKTYPHLAVSSNPFFTELTQLVKQRFRP